MIDDLLSVITESSIAKSQNSNIVLSRSGSCGSSRR